MKITRRLNLKPLSAQSAANKHREQQERYYVNMIMNSPYFRVIVQSLAEGTDIKLLAQHCVEQGWATVSERTFVEALRTFRRQKAELIFGYKPEDEKHLDNLVRRNAPELDELSALNQLIRLQQLRLGIEVENEINMGKLFNTTQKEIEVTGKLIETAAKIKGKISDRPRSADATSESSVEDLHKIKKEQVTMDRLHGLTRQLVEGKT